MPEQDSKVTDLQMIGKASPTSGFNGVEFDHETIGISPLVKRLFLNKASAAP